MSQPEMWRGRLRWARTLSDVIKGESRPWAVGGALRHIVDQSCQKLCRNRLQTDRVWCVVTSFEQNHRSFDARFHTSPGSGQNFGKVDQVWSTMAEAWPRSTHIGNMLAEFDGRRVKLTQQMHSGTFLEQCLRIFGAPVRRPGWRRVFVSVIVNISSPPPPPLGKEQLSTNS